jgi:hypothetical protein
LRERTRKPIDFDGDVLNFFKIFQSHVMGPESFYQLLGVSQALFRVFRVNHESMATQLACDLERFVRGVAVMERDVCAPIGQEDEDRGRRDIARGWTQGM